MNGYIFPRPSLLLRSFIAVWFAIPFNYARAFIVIICSLRFV